KSWRNDSDVERVGLRNRRNRTVRTRLNGKCPGCLPGQAGRSEGPGESTSRSRIHDTARRHAYKNQGAYRLLHVRHWLALLKREFSPVRLPVKRCWPWFQCDRAVLLRHLGGQEQRHKDEYGNDTTLVHPNLPLFLLRRVLRWQGLHPITALRMMCAPFSRPPSH